jgi:glycosyltransferase involved in cell wall biosynthesis
VDVLLHGGEVAAAVDVINSAIEGLPDDVYVLVHICQGNYAVGPDYDGLTVAKSGIREYRNIHWLGPKDYRALPAYLAAFDVATIPFQVTKALQAVSPIKLFEYMAGGRPIVSTDLLECRKYPVTLIARTQEEWVAQLRRAVQLRHDEEYLARVRATALDNTWVARAESLVGAMTLVSRHASSSHSH